MYQFVLETEWLTPRRVLLVVMGFPIPISNLDRVAKNQLATMLRVREMECALSEDKFVYRLCTDHVNSTNAVRSNSFLVHPNSNETFATFIPLAVNVTSNCPIPFAEEACSTDGRTFPSLCNLIKSKSQLAYNGPCLKGCNYHTKDMVCGMNGVTYKSECDAWSGMLRLSYHSAVLRKKHLAMQKKNWAKFSLSF